MGPWLDDPELRPALLRWAALLGHADVLMVNKAQDELFPVDGVHDLFRAVAGSRKRLMFWEGDHDEWPDEAIETSAEFLRSRVGATAPKG